MAEASLMGAVAGIDVGGDKKGCTLVVLQGTSILCSINSRTPEDLVQVCAKANVMAVGVDAPCQWRTGGSARLAEKELARARISSFSTPTRELAASNAANFYRWMFNGERVYQALTPMYPLLLGRAYGTGRVSFETFPYAITCAMLGRDVASAKRKRTQRRELLEQAGIDTGLLKSIDAVDARPVRIDGEILTGREGPLVRRCHRRVHLGSCYYSPP